MFHIRLDHFLQSILRECTTSSRVDTVVQEHVLENLAERWRSWIEAWAMVTRTKLSHIGPVLNPHV